MRIAVFGASGRTGHHLIRQALDSGHRVTGVVRNASRVQISDDRLDVVETDIFDPEAVAPAIGGCDAVASALGGTSPKAPPVCQPGARSIMQAMTATGVKRLVVVSNSAHTAERGDTVPRRLVQLILGQILRAPFEDLKRMEHDVRESSLDWTILRPARMTDGPRTGRYRLAIGQHVPNGWSISRADVADAILRVLTDDGTVRNFVGQAY
ncbi:NAD(P)-dependent oxidoreductase [Gandjariella thermophila]|uniref:NADH-flavin reductase n=1 Tax=Gandjariella thermophila TaxID=1931992 RepID=A0A4D4JCZ8_9PSEU|nr:SDR family oxidoreductase [Gandjariella thermophila]GDY31743.1 NADH-flavin reductase [Gandjariella thermophila]